MRRGLPVSCPTRGRDREDRAIAPPTPSVAAPSRRAISVARPGSAGVLRRRRAAL